jgi:hypothetical protein
MVRLKGSCPLWALLIGFLVPAEGKAGQEVRLWDAKGISGQEIEIAPKKEWEVISSAVTDYSFKGDVALENERILLLFCSETGSILLHAEETRERDAVEIILLDSGGARSSSIRSARILKNSEDVVRLEISLLSERNQLIRHAVSMGRGKPFVEIQPIDNGSAVQVRARSRFTIIPAFGERFELSRGGDGGQDIVFSPRDYSASHILLPAENIVLNLIEGEDRIVVMTWPSGKQTVSAFLSGEGERRLVDATEVTFDKQSVTVGILEAPGIWHEVSMDALSYFKDVAIDWRRPFAAGWKTDFYQGKRSISLNFFDKRSTQWQPEKGFIVYPCWFDGEKTFFHLNKKTFKHNGTAIIYPLAGKDTPATVVTPADILSETVGDDTYEYILAPGKRSSDYYAVDPWPGMGDSLLGACAAGDALVKVFKNGLAAKQPYLVDDFVGGILNTVDHTLRQIEGLRLSSRKIVQFISAAKKENPALIPFLEEMEKILRAMEEEVQSRFYTPWLRMIGKKALWKEPRAAVMEHTIEVGEKIKKLAREDHHPEQLIEMRSLPLGYWMSEGVTAVYRHHLKNLAQEAVIVAAQSENPDVMRAAEKIRRLAREARRNPGWGL